MNMIEGQLSNARCAHNASHLQGPTCHFCWNAAAPAIVHIARKLKNACEAWNMMAGFDTIIYKRINSRELSVEQ